MSPNAPIPSPLTRLSSPPSGGAAVRRRVVAIVATLALAWAGACTGDSDEAIDDTSVTTGTGSDDATDGDTTTTTGDDATDPDPSTDVAAESDGDEVDGDEPDGDEPMATTTTEPEATTTTPKPTVQPQDSALACAQVEIGYLRLLNDGTGDDELRTGAQLAQATGKATYEDLGDALAAAIGSDDAADAADALLTQCEADGYERLA